MSETAPYNPETEIKKKTNEGSTFSESLEKQPKFDFEELKQVLSNKVDLIQKQFQLKHRNVLQWATRQGYVLHNLSETGGKIALSAGLVGSLLLGGTPMTEASPIPVPEQGQTLSTNTAVETVNPATEGQTLSTRNRDQVTIVSMQQNEAENQEQLMAELLHASQQAVVDANQIAGIVEQLTGVPAAAELEEYRLNTNVGRIGAEQHLRVYPGQSLEDHFANKQEYLQHKSSGFAMGNGAWGTFATSQHAVTPQDIQREKYYVAVQTFLSPNWNNNVSQTYNWFKYRKVIVYHPITQKAVVAVVGDAGPAPSTGKSFGGSPEVMSSLSAYDGYGTPPVLLFFVDDPDNTIPLGPIDFKVKVGG